MSVLISPAARPTAPSSRILVPSDLVEKLENEIAFYVWVKKVRERQPSYDLDAERKLQTAWVNVAKSLQGNSKNAAQVYNRIMNASDCYKEAGQSQPELTDDETTMLLVPRRSAPRSNKSTLNDLILRVAKDSNNSSLWLQLFNTLNDSQTVFIHGSPLSKGDCLKKYEELEILPLIGCLEKNPQDLSTWTLLSQKLVENQIAVVNGDRLTREACQEKIRALRSQDL